MKFSIVIAAYNIENYIEKCINSCINQTYGNLEIIIVNDGSTDGTLKKILSIKDDRIIVIDKENEGVTAARNIGMLRATGDYILFVDGDDWLDKNLFSILKNKLIIDNYDVVLFNFNICYEDRTIKNELELYNNDLLYNVLVEPIPYIWMKLIKRRFLIDNNIILPNNINYAEDLALSVMIAVYNPNSIYVNENLYNYYQRGSSVTKKINKSILDVRKSTDFIKDMLKDRNLIERYKEEFEFCQYKYNFLNRVSNIFTENIYSEKLFENWLSLDCNIKKNKYFKKKVNYKMKLISYMTMKNRKLGVFLFKIFK